jgi:cobalt-zinc-cadmium efflux system protein
MEKNMAHDHSHEVMADKKRLSAAVILTLLFVAGEFVAGYLTHSLALLSDSGHNLADAIALILSWYALSISLKPHDSIKTFGYHRAGTLSALVNAFSLVVIALIIMWEAIVRIIKPEPVMGAPMVIVALVAIVINSFISFWLHSGAKHDLNMRSAYLHMLGDALAGVGVVIAGLIIWLTGKSIADPIVSLVIGVLILYSSRGIWLEAVGTLMEATPPGLDADILQQTVCSISGVRDVHCLHMWAVGSGVTACSCHVTIDPEKKETSQNILRQVVDTLEDRFHFAHTTIQIEVDGFAPTEACENGQCRGPVCLSATDHVHSR